MNSDDSSELFGPRLNTEENNGLGGLYAVSVSEGWPRQWDGTDPQVICAGHQDGGSTRVMSKSKFERQRERLIKHELRGAGIRDEAVLRAMRLVPREEFVAEEFQAIAYRNAPLPIAAGQTISQPLMVASMAESLQLSADERVLEIGTGSGYAAAVLAQIASEVFTVERHVELVQTARERLQRLGYDNIHLLHGDGTRGWAEKSPFQAIVVAAAGPRVPPALLEQLDINGRLVIPLGNSQESQRLFRVIRKDADAYDYETLMAVRFVPLVGDS